MRQGNTEVIADPFPETVESRSTKRHCQVLSQRIDLSSVKD
jgi:hypothetical protein